MHFVIDMRAWTATVDQAMDNGDSDAEDFQTHASAGDCLLEVWLPVACCYTSAFICATVDLAGEACTDSA